MNYNITETATTTVKKVYYVLKRTSVFAANTELYAVQAPNGSLHFDSLAKATKYANVRAAIAGLEMRGGFILHGTAVDIVRVEETPGVVSRKVVTESSPEFRSNAKWVIQAGNSEWLATDGSLPFKNYSKDIAKAVLFDTESAALFTLTKAALSIGAPSWDRSVKRVIEVPATPTITETVLA